MTLADIGIVLQGGLYNNTLRALELLGYADVFGTSRIPLYVLNVTYPLVSEEWVRFCAGKRAVLVIEEGQPEFIEQAANQILRQQDVHDAHLVGKEVLPMFGEYTVDRAAQGHWRLSRAVGAAGCTSQRRCLPPAKRMFRRSAAAKLAALVPARPSGLCTGCPERPFFAAMKILQKEIGPLHISADIGCHSFATLPPFNMGNSIMGYGLGAAGASAFGTDGGKRAVSIMGDGGFWHNGLTSGIGNSVFNKHDDLTSHHRQRLLRRHRRSGHPVFAGAPVRTARVITRSSRPSKASVSSGSGAPVPTTCASTLKLLREALHTSERGPKVIVADGECQLNRQRRVRPLERKAIQSGERVVRERFGIDPDTCTGDHSCIRLSGCPSLTVKDNPDPLRSDPVAHVDNSCVGCGVCGEVADAAVLCPSFYRADLIHNPSRWDRLVHAVRAAVIGTLQRRDERRRLRLAL